VLNGLQYGCGIGKPNCSVALHVSPANQEKIKSRRADSNRLPLLITRKNRRVSVCWRLFQNPLDKPNTRTSNIVEQPEIRAGWCRVGVQILASARPYSVKLATGTKGLE
jgi:hypothetical protein